MEYRVTYIDSHFSSQVSIEILKLPGKTLGFSIAGGRGSTPAYEDVDEVGSDSSTWDAVCMF